MSTRFEGLIERLEADIETVHGRRLALQWTFLPTAPIEERWGVIILGIPGPQAQAFAHDGETPLLRLVEDYAAKAHLVRERNANAKKKPA